MDVSRTKKATRNLIASIVNRILMIICPFLLRTVMIHELGIEYLGLNSFFVSVLQVLNLTELGFGSAVVYSMYKPIAEEDQDRINALLTFYKGIYRIIGCSLLIIGLIFMPFISCFIKSDYPNDINIYVVFAVYLLNSVISYFLWGYKSSILIASQRNDLELNVVSFGNFFLHVFQIISLLLTRNYYILIFFLPFFSIITNLIRYFVVKKRYPNLKENGDISKREKRKIISNVFALFGHRVGGVVFTSVDSLVISSFLGLVVLGKYSNYFLIYSAINGVMSVLFQSVLSVIGNSIVCKSNNDNLKVFNELFIFNAWQSCFCSTCLMCLYQPFMLFWMGKENLLPLSIVFFLSLYYYLFNIRRVCCAFKDAAGMWKNDFWKPYISVIVNLISNLLLVQIIGLPGVIISSIIAVALVESPWETKVLFSDYFKSETKKYYFKYFLGLFVCLLSLSLSFVICTKIPYDLLGGLCLVVVCFVLPNLLFYLVFFKTNEFKLAVNRVYKIIGRR